MPDRRIHRPGGRRREAEIPTGSFADIAFLLIIFFILVTTLAVTEGFVAEIPQGEKTQAKQEKTTTVMLAGGKITLNDKPVSLDELRRRLAEMDLARQSGNDKIVLLEQMGRDPWQGFYEVWAAIGAAGGEVVIVLAEGEED